MRARDARQAAAAAVRVVVEEVEAVVDHAVAVVVDAVTDLGRRHSRRLHLHELAALTDLHAGRAHADALRARGPGVVDGPDAVVDDAVAVVVDAVADLDAAVGELALAAVAGVPIGVDEAGHAAGHRKRSRPATQAARLLAGAAHAMPHPPQLPGSPLAPDIPPATSSTRPLQSLSMPSQTSGLGLPPTPTQTTPSKLALYIVVPWAWQAPTPVVQATPTPKPSSVIMLQLLSMPSQRSTTPGPMAGFVSSQSPCAGV